MLSDSTARVGNRGAVTLPTRDGRVTFVLPWGELALVGTTDTEHSGGKDEVEATPEDVEYLLNVVNDGFPEARLTRTDIVATYAGLRPLIDTGETKESVAASAFYSICYRAWIAAASPPYSGAMRRRWRPLHAPSTSLPTS